MDIRLAELKDLKEIVEIYNFYIKNSTATFDEDVLTPQDRQKWFNKFSSNGPYRLLVADIDNNIVGYACSMRYRNHKAFNETVEMSIYISSNQTQSGIGSKLYAELFTHLEEEQIFSAVVGISLPNPASIALHEKFGFTKVGVFEKYASKNSERISSLWMQRVPI